VKSLKGGPEPGLAALENLVEESRTNQYWKVARAYSNSLFNFPKDISLDEFESKAGTADGNHQEVSE
jgi:hypothetical protein